MRIVNKVEEISFLEMFMNSEHHLPEKAVSNQATLTNHIDFKPVFNEEMSALREHRPSRNKKSVFF